MRCRAWKGVKARAMVRCRANKCVTTDKGLNSLYISIVYGVAIGIAVSRKSPYIELKTLTSITDVIVSITLLTSQIIFSGIALCFTRTRG